MTKILDGQKVASKIIQKIRKQIKGQKLSIAIVSLGSDDNTKNYLEQKEKMALGLGVGFHLFEMLPIVDESQIIKLIKDLNKSSSVSGIVVQLPLPKNLNQEKILGSIEIEKDIDGLNPKNREMAATSLAIMKILDYYRIGLKNKKVGILGRGYLVGEPLSLILKKKKVNFEVWNSKTPNIASKTKLADILISATGQANLIKPEMVKKNGIVIDCGGSRPELSEEANKHLSAYSPVPGGLGPVTVAVLFENLLKNIE